MRIGTRDILMVGQSGHNFWSTAIMLTRFGHEVHFAENAEKGLDKLAQYEFDLIIIESHLPDSNGKDVLDAIPLEIRKRVIYIVNEQDTMLNDEEISSVYEVVPGFPPAPEFAVLVCDFFLQNANNREEFERFEQFYR